MAKFKLVNGERVQMTAAEETARDAEVAAWTAGEDGRALQEMRQKRNRLLVETDWYAVSDLTMSADMTTYRQALRDLPAGKTTKAHVDAATWPTKPAG